MNGYQKYIIPCSLLDIQGLERFFEKKAQKGYLIRSFSKWSDVGRFEEVLEGTCHFCIDIYRKDLTKKDEGDPEFLEYIEECEALGWIYTCTYKNLVIFYNRDEDRPLELKRNKIAARQYLVDITCPEEKRMLLRQSLYSAGVMSFWFILLFLGFWKDGTEKNMGIWIYCLIFLSGLMFINLSGAIARYIQNLRIGNALEKGNDYLLRPVFWDEDMIMSLVLLITEFALFLWSYQIFSVRSAVLSSCSMVISAAILGLGRIKYRMGKKWKYPIIIRLCCIVPLILLSISVKTTPTVCNYRYELHSNTDNYGGNDKKGQMKEAVMRMEEKAKS